jgi:hypothetical protein
MRSCLPFALVFLAACGGSDPKTLTSEGYALLGKGDARGALARFETALDGLAPASPDYARASLGRCVALARTDGSAAKAAFLDLAQRAPDVVREDDYGLVCSEMVQADFLVDAVDVMDAGMQRYPESPRMIATKEALEAAAKSAKTPDALKKLQTLGYAGG